MKSNYKMLISNVLYFLICSIAVKLIGYILLPIFTSYMSTEEYGVADILMSTHNLVYPIFALGISGAVMRYCMDKESDARLIFTSGCIALSASTIVSFFMIPVIRLFPTYAPYAVLVPISVMLTNYLAMVSALCKGLDKTKLIVYQNIVYGIALLISAIVTVKFLGLGVTGYLLSYIIANVFSIMMLSVSINLKKYISFKYSGKEIGREIKKLLKYGIPLVPNSLAWWITQMSDRYMVTYWYGATTNGLYSVAYKIPSIINAGVNTFIQAWQLSAIHEFKEKNSEEFYNSIYKYYSAFCYLLTSIVMICGRLLAKILFAKDFYVAWVYVPLLLVAAAVGSQGSFFGTFYMADNRTKRYFMSSVIGAILNVVLNIMLIPKLSVLGATIATVASYFVVYIQRAIDITKTVEINIHLAKNLFAMAVLMAQAIVYSADMIPIPARYGASIFALAIIFIMFFSEVREIFLRFMHLIRSRFET